MGDKSKIEWTDATWNPVRGCSRVSEGCRNCYAEEIASRFSGPGLAYDGLATRRGGEARWTGNVWLIEEHLADPLRWTRPRRIFVNSMSDLFHEKLDDATIDRVFAVMILTGMRAMGHTFQVLTKRPTRMLKYLTAKDRHVRWTDTIKAFRECPHWFGALSSSWWRDGGAPYVWLGVSAENQATADERIPELLATPAAVRFVSAEPLLGPIDFKDAPGRISAAHEPNCHSPGLDWVIVGGESGPNARPMHIDWARGIRDQCVAAGVSFFFKQWGEWETLWERRDDPDDRRVPPESTLVKTRRVLNFDGGHGFHGERVTIVRRVGKHTAGRALDGRTWDEFPFART